MSGPNAAADVGPGGGDERRLVADRLRDLADQIVSHELDADGWSQLETELARLRDRFPHGPPGPSVFGRSGSHAPAHHPLHTSSTGAYPPVDAHFEGELLVLTLEFGAAWEGPVNTVHGGFLAAAFDIGCSILAHQRLGSCVTRSLRLRYLRPTPLHRRLRLEVTAGDVNGRLLDLTARLTVEGRTTTTGVAQFASLRPRPG